MSTTPSTSRHTQTGQTGFGRHTGRNTKAQEGISRQAGGQTGGTAQETQAGQDENRYLKRFESEFHAILNEISIYSSVIPQYKTENDSLKERIQNIRNWAEAASKARYLPGTDPDAVLANLIAQILVESDKIDELKPIAQSPQPTGDVSTDLFELLTYSRGVAMDEAFQGFDFFDNNPYKKQAEKKIAKMQKRNKK